MIKKKQGADQCVYDAAILCEKIKRGECVCVCEHNCLHTYKTCMEDTQDIGALGAFENGAKLRETGEGESFYLLKF